MSEQHLIKGAAQALGNRFRVSDGFSVHTGVWNYTSLES